MEVYVVTHVTNDDWHDTYTVSDVYTSKSDAQSAVDRWYSDDTDLFHYCKEEYVDVEDFENNQNVYKLVSVKDPEWFFYCSIEKCEIK